MRTFIFFYVIFFLWLSLSDATGQDTRVRVSETLNQVPLESVLTLLRNKYKLPLVYNSEDIPAVSVRETFVDVPAEQVLNVLLAGLPLSWKTEKDGQIILFKDMKKTLSQLLTDDGVEITGTVCIKTTGEPVENIRVQIADLPNKTLSGPGGFFTLKNVLPGEYRMIFSGEGFFNDTMLISVAQISVSLDTIFLAPVKLKKQIMPASKASLTDSMGTFPGAFVLSKNVLSNHPTLAEPDISYAMQTIPGFHSRNDLSRDLGFYGGLLQKTLTLNGATVYFPYHFFGQTAVVHPGIVEWVHVYGGVKPSSDNTPLITHAHVYTPNRSDKTISGSGQVSLLTVQGTIQSQIKDKVHVLISGRRNYLDQLTALAKKIENKLDLLPTYLFYDVYAQTDYQINNQFATGVFGFISRDRFTADMKKKQYEEEDNQNPQRVFLEFSEVKHGSLNWGNALFGTYFRYTNNYNWSTRIEYKQTYGDIRGFNKKYYQYTSRASLPVRRMVDSLNQLKDPDRMDLTNRITDYSVLWAHELALHPSHQLRFGADFRTIRLDYGWNAPIDDPSKYENNKYVQLFYDNPPDTFHYRKTGYVIALYTEDVWRIGKRWIVCPGFRFEHFVDARQGWFFSPRVSARFQATPTLVLKTAAGIHYQPLFTSLDQGALNLFPLPFYPDRLSVPRIFQMALGSEFSFQKYFKWSNDLFFHSASRIKKNYTSSVNTPDWINGHSQALGWLTSISGSFPWTGFVLSYQLSDSRKTFQRQTYYDYTDRRHQFESTISFFIPNNLTLDIRWTFASAQAYRPVNYYTTLVDLDPLNGSVNSGGEGFLSYRNTDHLNIYSRLPVYHRMDVSFQKIFPTKGLFTFKMYINVLNVYNRKNPIVYEDQMKFIRSQNSHYSYAMKSKAYGIPILPSLGMGFEF